jgi:hypothetical protein
MSAKRFLRHAERNWPALRRVKGDAFRSICQCHEIADERQAQFREFLDDLVEHGTRMQAAVRGGRFPSDVRKELLRKKRELEKAAETIAALDWRSRSGRLLSMTGVWEFHDAAGPILAELISPMYWSHAILAETPRSLAERDAAASRNWRNSFARDRGPEIAAHFLTRLASSLQATSERLSVPKGRPLLVVGPWVLMNIAAEYGRLGRRPTKSAIGPFGRFATDIVAAMGWETDWIRNHIGQAVARHVAAGK